MPREQLEAILLVGGKGTRLRPLTLSVPKPLLPTAGVPFLCHQLARAAASGITHVVLATSYRSQMFGECLGDGSAFGLRIDYVHEGTPLGTGGGIRNAAGRLRGGPGDPVVVLNGDILSGHDIGAQVNLHSEAGAAATLHLIEVADPARYGCVPADERGRVTAFLEKTPDPVTNLVNAGCYVFTRRVIDEIPAGRRVSVERETFPALIQRGDLVMAFPDSGYWLDVGTPEAFVRGSCDLVLGKLPAPALPSPVFPGPPGPSLRLPGALVGEGADVSAGSVLGAGSVVSPGAVVGGSVLFDEARVGPGAVVRGSILGRGAEAAEGAVLDGVVIGDGAYVGPGNELARGMRVWPGVRLGPTAIRFSSDA